MLTKIISGGQTGVDRAALDVAISKGIKHGGYCPKGRIAEDGVIADKYNLLETKSTEFDQRTKKNIEKSDGTLVFVAKLPLEVKDGTLLTIEYAKSIAKPLLIVDLSNCSAIDYKFGCWLLEHKIKILNVGGPRASNSSGIYDKAYNCFGQMVNFVLISSNFNN